MMRLPALTHSSACLVLAILVLSGCATGERAMSVEEAKQIAATFQGSAFIPPPRTIRDITLVLEGSRPDPAALTRAKAQADRLPPASSDPAALTDFYFQRGRAAGVLGRARQEIDDLSEALRHARAGTPGREIEVLYWLSVAESLGGSFARSIGHLEDAIGRVPPTLRGWLITLNAALARAQASEGDVRTAEVALERCLAVLAESEQWTNTPPSDRAVWTAFAANAQGAVASARGRVAEAERSYRRAAEVLARDPVQAQGAALETIGYTLALNLVQQGRLLEAENEARRALLGTLRKRGRHSAHAGLVLQGLVAVLGAQARYAEAETLARAAIDIYTTIGSDPGTASFIRARWWLAAALSAQRRSRETLEQYDLVRAAATKEPEGVGRFLASHLGLLGQVSHARALLWTRRVDEALEILSSVLEQRTRLYGADHPATVDVRAWLAVAHAVKGDHRRALREFAETVPILIARTGAGEDASGARDSLARRVVLVIEAYMTVLAEVGGTPLERELGLDAGREAFQLAEAARGHAIQQALEASATRSAAGTPALADLVRREQDAAKQLTALRGTLANALSLSDEGQNASSVRSLRGQIDTLTKARRTLAQQIEREFPAYARLINPSPVTVDGVRAVLRPDEALVVTYAAPERTFVWAIPHQGEVAFAVVPVGAAALAEQVSHLRKALDPRVRRLGEIPAFDVIAAYRLYATLLEPVRRGWSDARTLLVVPHGPLGHVPFALLPTTAPHTVAGAEPLFGEYRVVPWLIRTHAVAMLPSVGALVSLRGQPRGHPERRPFVGFGDPYFSLEQAREAHEPPVTLARPSSSDGTVALRDLEVAALDSARLSILPRLPDTAEEIRSIAAALDADPARDVFLGERANERAVKTLDLARYRVIAFATHGLVAGDLDGLTQPALALTAPEVARVDGDGLLTMEEILALRLDADWVVLSACNTASGDGAGAEAVSGLGRAFFYAGARALLVSNWPVETTSARALTTDLFRRQAVDPALSRARALQQTMLGLIDGGAMRDLATGAVVFSYAHPIFWAPFSLVGDGG